MSNLTECQCGHEYDPAENFTFLPNNMHIYGVDPAEKIPQCPECKKVDFTNIAKQQLANDPRRPK